MANRTAARKPPQSVRTPSTTHTGSEPQPIYRARCRNPKCRHEWNAKSSDPLKCGRCQTLRPECWVYTLDLAEAVNQ